MGSLHGFLRDSSQAFAPAAQNEDSACSIRVESKCHHLAEAAAATCDHEDHAINAEKIARFEYVHFGQELGLGVGKRSVVHLFDQ